MSKQYLIAANWKMNLDVHEASVLVHKLDAGIRAYRDVEIVLAPSLLHVQPLSLQIDHRKFKLGAQNAYHKDSGAFTGEVSFTMLQGLVDYVIIGHSERRMYFGESLELIRDKVAAAVRNGIKPILCVGETEHERKLGETKQVLHDQIVTALANLTSEDIENVVIAYEPRWAIGTGTPATPDQIADAVKYVRRQVDELYGSKVAQSIRILYGASVDEDFVKTVLSVDGVNGLLVGGASLQPHKFIGIVEAAHALARETHGT